MLHVVHLRRLFFQQRYAENFHADISIPVRALQTDQTDLRFHFTREHNIKGIKTEFSAWSPPSMLGNWQGVDNYATVTFLPH